MSDNADFFNSDDYWVSDTTSPFYGLPISDVDFEPDPNELLSGQVLEALGVESLGEVFVDITEDNIDDLRGNVFPNIIDAIIYLYQSGILIFSNIGVDDNGDPRPIIPADSGRFLAEETPDA